MDQKTYNKITGAIFAIFTIAHLARILGQWDVELGNWEVPMGVSYVVIFVTAYIAYSAYKLKK